MSGIVGIVQFDGSPVKSGLLRRLTESLAFRGPDNLQIWIKQNVGFGHTLFKTTEESDRDCQPLTLDGKTWIVADARIDAREELFAAFKAAGQPEIAQSCWTDAELILRAYQVWGWDCAEHLFGDFAFGIWDDSRQQLFCARDHMGVKPFYYAKVGSCVIFSNTLDCIRQHPLISDKLNDLFIADFLLFGFSQDPASTSFAQIERIPPAHCAVWSRNEFSIRRYWSMPIDDPLFYKRADDYTDHFQDILRKCVADRLRTNRVWVFMSGGIDSPTLAATARDLLQQRHQTSELVALTHVDSFVPDERRYAGIVASYLEIPIEYRYWADVRDFDWEQVPFSLPEPCPDACLIPGERQFWSGLETYARVFLYGEGPDNALLLDWLPYIAYLVKHHHYGLLAQNVLSTIMSERRPPFWGRLSKRTRFASYLADNRESAYPSWLIYKFEAGLQLREKWHALNSPQKPLHPVRPKAYASLQAPLWQCLFEHFDPEVTKASFEARHPFLDIRMLRFLLAVPPLPWCRAKYLFRKAMRGRLPSQVLRRGKTTPNSRSLETFLAKFCRSPFHPTAEVREYIDPNRLPNSSALVDVEGNLRVRSLNHWLKNWQRSSDNPQERVLCDRFAR